MHIVSFVLSRLYRYTDISRSWVKCVNN